LTGGGTTAASAAASSSDTIAFFERVKSDRRNTDGILPGLLVLGALVMDARAAEALDGVDATDVPRDIASTDTSSSLSLSGPFARPSPAVPPAPAPARAAPSSLTGDSKSKTTAATTTTTQQQQQRRRRQHKCRIKTPLYTLYFGDKLPTSTTHAPICSVV
jgi:hypothetical protein